MSSISFKRTIRQYEFLIEDLNDVEELFKKANHALNSEILQAKADSGIREEPQDPVIPEEEEPEVETFEDTVERKALKSLFRKIVKVSHPDRLKSDISESDKAEIVEHYENAVIALDTNDWAKMVIIAIKLGVELPEIAYEQIESIEESIKEMEADIERMTNSLAWKWYHAEEAERKKIVDNYIVQLKELKARKEKERHVLVVGYPGDSFDYVVNMLKLWGADIDVDVIKGDGMASWKVLFDSTMYGPYSFEHIVYVVDDPVNVLESKSKSLEVSKFTGTEGTNTESTIIRTLQSFDEIVRSLNPSFVFGPMGDPKKLHRFLTKRGMKLEYQQPEPYSPEIENGSLSKAILLRVDKRRLNMYCEKFNMKSPF